MKKLILALAALLALTTGSIPTYAVNSVSEGPNYRAEHLLIMNETVRSRVPENDRLQIAYDLPDEVIDSASSYEMPIEIWETDSLTLEDITSRQERNALVIERLVGVVLNEDGDGRVLNTSDPYYNYISYRSVPNAHTGDIVVTYCIYDPSTDVEDDIMERFDTIICNSIEATRLSEDK